uniref:Ig-like domain-containing protein n=1 Tax=Leptobrachium leishanense TaxID=445787 RepID=A0A8C5PH60_9ANUR
MKLMCLLLTSHRLVSGSVAQFEVIQEATLSVSLSTDVRLSCSRSVGSVTGDNYPSWIKQIPGEVPQLVVGSPSTSNQNWRPSWTSARFTGAISGGSSVLTISTVQAADDGNYYCALYTGSQCTVLRADAEVGALPQLLFLLCSN